MQIHPDTFDFLQELKKNNTREWFAENKSRYDAIYHDWKAVMEEIGEGMRATDEIEKVKVFRIYRDIRFSKDKTPFKTNMAGSLVRSGADRRGGLYVHLQKDRTFIGVGFWNPNKEDLQRIREEIDLDSEEFREHIARPEFADTWGPLEGDQLLTAPRNYDIDHEDIDLLRYKSFTFMQSISNKKAQSKQFVPHVVAEFNKALPWLDYMTAVLTSNSNGESLLDK